mgnify:CR=1 FL=1
MKTNIFYSLIFFLCLNIYNSSAQEFIQEIGISVGPVSFRGDYGEKQDSETNVSNSGIGVSLSHFLNFAYGGSSGSYFGKHFKVRSQLTYQNSSLEHLGSYAEGEGEGAKKLKAMTGKVTSFEATTGLQWFYKEIRDYERSTNTFSPYAGVGAGAVFSTPSNESSLEGGLDNPENIFPTFKQDAINNDSETTLAFNFQLGTQYRLRSNSDLFVELRLHLYTSDYIEGLSPIGDQNGADDTSAWLAVGYLYYF